jgi:coenzyme Q-binding protein COQ10
MPGASRTVVIHAPADVLFDVITDYASYPQFLSDVADARLVQRSGDTAIVEFGLNLIKKIHYSLKMTEVRPTSVRWVLHESSLMKANVGGWTLEPLPDGTTRATYEVDVTPKGFVPGPIVNALTGRTLPATLEAFKQRAEARARQA